MGYNSINNYMEGAPIIERKEYMDRLIGFRDKHIIKIITGIRRCGKSTVLELFRQYLLSEGVSPEQIIAVNFEDYGNRRLRETGALHDYVTGHMAECKPTYVFLDEIQNVAGFQEVVDSLYLRRNPQNKRSALVGRRVEIANR